MEENKPQSRNNNEERRKTRDLIKIVRILEANKDRSRELITPLIELYTSQLKDIRGYLDSIGDSKCYSQAVRQFERLKSRGNEAISMNNRLYFPL